MAWTDLSTWTLIDQRELLNEPIVDEKRSGLGGGSGLSIRSTIKPVDIYGYLVGRFGEPNGRQSMLLRVPFKGSPIPDSGNIIHWDFEIRSGETRILLTGLTREVHILVSEDVTDDVWINFIQNIKEDFGRFAKEKSKAQNRFEKWLVFANPYASIAESCAILHDRINEVLEEGFIFEAMGPDGFANEAYRRQLEAASERANRLYSDCLQLRMLTPILGEAFINMLTSFLARPEIKDDPDNWHKLQTSSFHDKLESLSDICLGFSNPLDKSSSAYRNFMRIRSRRNDIIHANVNPRRDKIETVYFDGKIPLYAEAGDIFKKFWDKYEAWVDPKGAISEYEDVHLFFIEVKNSLNPRLKWELRAIIETDFPGYDESRKKFGKLFPDHLAHFQMGPQQIRYDDQLSRGE